MSGVAFHTVPPIGGLSCMLCKTFCTLVFILDINERHVLTTSVSQLCVGRHRSPLCCRFTLAPKAGQLPIYYALKAIGLVCISFCLKAIATNNRLWAKCGQKRRRQFLDPRIPISFRQTPHRRRILQNPRVTHGLPLVVTLSPPYRHQLLKPRPIPTSYS